MKRLLLLLYILNGLSSNAQLSETLDNVWIPMRDGDSLQADVFIPTGVDSAQVILIQTPYNKELFFTLPMGVGLNLDSQPFIWVIVDWRGFYGSSNANVSNVNRGEDGYDVCEWISQQTWHKDRIGTWGPSALGGVQYATMREQHPSHTCAVPLVAHPQQAYDDYFMNGVLEEARLQQLDALGYGLSPIILSNVYYGALWTFTENDSWYPQDVAIPTLQIGGWYDHNIDKMTEWYKATRNSAVASVQDEQWFLVGPWVHGGSGAAYVGSSVQGELNYPNAEYVSDTMAWEFFEYYLLDSANNWQNTDFITYYETGKDVWATSNATSVEELNSDELYLNYNGKLVSGPTVQSTSFVSDPNNPSPTIGGATLHSTLDQGPYDQVSLEGRSDIITFATDALLADVSISGRVSLNLYVESDQPDCDISIRLVDVYPDGRNMLITDGIQRMRFRNGYYQSDEVFMTPGVVYNVQFDLPFTNYTWQSGHKIKIYVGGNNSIRYNVNLQDGGQMYTAGSGNVANITIHHNGTYPSSISFPGNNPILGIADQAEAVEFTVYPNPAKDILHVDSEVAFDSYTIVDLTGREILSSQNFVNSIDVGDLAKGAYLLILSQGEVRYERRFVKN